MTEYRVRRKPLKSSHVFVKMKEILISPPFAFFAFAFIIISLIVALGILAPTCGGDT